MSTETKKNETYAKQEEILNQISESLDKIQNINIKINIELKEGKEDLDEIETEVKNNIDMLDVVNRKIHKRIFSKEEGIGCLIVLLFISCIILLSIFVK
jgi:hypothetical protein